MEPSDDVDEINAGISRGEAQAAEFFDLDPVVVEKLQQGWGLRVIVFRCPVHGDHMKLSVVPPLAARSQKVGNA